MRPRHLRLFRFAFYVLLSFLPVLGSAQTFFHSFAESGLFIQDISFDGQTVLLSDGSIWKPGEGVVHRYPESPHRFYRNLAPDGSYVSFSDEVWNEYYEEWHRNAYLAYPDGTETLALGFSPPDSRIYHGGHGIWPIWKRYFDEYVVATADGFNIFDYPGMAFDEIFPSVSPDGETLYGTKDGRLVVYEVGTEDARVVSPESYPPVDPKTISTDGTFIAGIAYPEGETYGQFWLYEEGEGMTTLPGLLLEEFRGTTDVSDDGSVVQMGNRYWVNGEPFTFTETFAQAGHPLGPDEANEFFISEDASVLASHLSYLRVGESATGTHITPLHLEMGEARFARYDGIAGSSLADLHAAESFPDSPDSVEDFGSFEFQGDGDNFGVYAWAWLVPERTDEYVFWIASDDESVLSLSPNGDSTQAEIIARVPSHTHPREFNRFPEQQSEPIHLEAGHAYYIEAQMKQGWGDSNLSVAWKRHNRAGGPRIISGRVLGLPYADGGTTPHPVFVDESANIAFYDNIFGSSLDALYASDRFPDEPDEVVPFGEAAGNGSALSTWINGQNLGVYAWTWFVPDATGPHTFWLSSDDQGELWLSDSGLPSDAALIASVPSDTNFENFDWFAEQQSAPVRLEAGKPYYLSAVVKQGWSNAHFSVLTEDPDGNTALVGASQMTTMPGNAGWPNGAPPADALETGALAMARYNTGRNLSSRTAGQLGSLRESIKFPHNPDELFTVPSFNYRSPDHGFGLFAWGWLIPEVSGDYRFWLLSDDQGELYLSSSADPADAAMIAHVEWHVGHDAYDRYESQRSVVITLEAGQPYYIAGLVQQDYGDGMLKVLWEGPGFSRQIIPGRVLALPTAPGQAAPQP